MSALRRGSARSHRVRRRVNSPQLLQLSGSVPASCSPSFGIPVLLDNPRSAATCRITWPSSYSFKATQPTVNDELNSPLARDFVRRCATLFTRRGPLSLSVNQFGGFLRADPAAARPDVQLYFNPVTYRRGRCESRAHRARSVPGLLFLCFQPTRPTSRGRIDIASADYRQAPAIAPNYLSTDKDQRRRRARRIADPAIARTGHALADRESIAPDLDAMTPPTARRFSRARRDGLSPGQHLPHGERRGDSVVDPQLRVHGIERCASWMRRFFRP
jgi:choline dehydrogenase